MEDLQLKGVILHQENLSVLVGRLHRLRLYDLLYLCFECLEDPSSLVAIINHNLRVIDLNVNRVGDCSIVVILFEKGHFILYVLG